MTGKVKKQTDSSTQSSPTWPNSSTEREFRFKFSLARFRFYPWFSLAKTKGKVLSFPWLKPRVNPHQNTTSCHTTRQRVDEPSKRPPRCEMTSEMGKKKPSSQSERPTPNQGLPRQEAKTGINVLPEPTSPQHLGALHHPHRSRIKNMDRPL